MSQRWKDNFLIFITFALSFLSFLSLMFPFPFFLTSRDSVRHCTLLYYISCILFKCWKKCIVRGHICCPLIHDSSFIHSFIHYLCESFFFSFFSAFVALHRLMHGLVCGGGKVFPAMVLDNLWAQAADQQRVECCNQLNVMLLNKYWSWKAPLGRKQ